MLEFHIGNVSVLKNMPDLPADQPFSAQRIDFLNQVSRELLSDKEAKAYPDIVTFAFWIRKGNMEKYKEHLVSGFANEQAMADLLKWYGSKEKAMEAVMQSTGSGEEIKQEQDENARIYKQFMAAKEAGNMDMAHSAVEMLAENYKTMFALDNARNILLDLAKEYLQGEKLAEATDSQFGKGCSEYVAHAIQHYYGA